MIGLAPTADRKTLCVYTKFAVSFYNFTTRSRSYGFEQTDNRIPYAAMAYDPEALPE